MNPDDTIDPIDPGGDTAPPIPPPDAPPESPTESAETTDSAEAPASNEQRVPLSELLRARQRAEQAEARAAQLSERVSELESTLAQTREALDAVERRQRIDRALMEADAHDLESARLLTEVALGAGEDTEIDAAVADLRRRKPFLFRSRSARAAPASQRATDALSTAAEHAARTGDRRALLRYLELRRTT